MTLSVIQILDSRHGNRRNNRGTKVNFKPTYQFLSSARN